MRRLLGTSTLVIAIMAASSASAQNVVMRRPLPNVGSTGTGTPTPTPPGTPTPTPTHTPTPAVCNPALEICPGDTYTPPVDKPTDPTPSGNIEAYWEVGDWQGSATCGQASTLTRSVQCYATVYDDDFNLVYDGYVAPSVCEQNSSDPVPPAVYSGTGGGCDYQIGYGDWGDWSGTCGSIYREAQPICLRNGTDQVPMSYCMNNPAPGGSYNSYPPDPQYDYSYTEDGCSYKWDAKYYYAHIGACVGGVRTVTYDQLDCKAFDGRTGEEAFLDHPVDSSLCGSQDGVTKISCTGGQPIDQPNLSCYTDQPVYAGPESYGIGANSLWDGKDQTCDAHPLPCCRSIVTTHKELVPTATGPQIDAPVVNVEKTVTGGETLSYYPGPRFIGRAQFCPQVGDPSGSFDANGRQYPVEGVGCSVIGN